jgi:hypothetical protein
VDPYCFGGAVQPLVLCHWLDYPWLRLQTGSEQLADVHKLCSPMFVFPCVLLALVPRWWAVVPLWLISISICLFPYVMNVQQNGALEYVNAPFSVQEIKEMAQVIIIPIAMLIALLIKGTGNQRRDHS